MPPFPKYGDVLPMSHTTKTTYKERQGQLTKIEGTSIKEFMIFNYTRVPIATMDHREKVVTHNPSQSPSLLRDDDHIVILSRFTTEGIKLDTYGHDTSNGVEGRTVIKLKDLYDGPKYVPDIDQVIYLKDHQGSIIHPHSKTHLERVAKNERHNALQTALYSPFLVMVRVTRKHPRFRRIYTVVHGRVVSTPTIVDDYGAIAEKSGLDLESSEFFNQLDITYHTDKGIIQHSTHNLEQLDKENPDGVYCIDGGYFSFDKDALSKLVRDGNYTDDTEIRGSMITKEEHREIVVRRLGDVTAENQRLESLVKAQEHRLKTLTKFNQQIRDHHGELKTVFELTEQLAHGENILNRMKIELNTAKTQAAVEKANREAVTKRQDELIKTIGNVAKAVTVVAPVAIGLFKLLKTNPS